MGVVSDDILWIRKIAVVRHVIVVVVVYNRRMLVAVLDNNTPPQGRKRWQRGEARGPFFLGSNLVVVVVGCWSSLS